MSEPTKPDATVARPERRRSKIGIYGGTFDPVHLGHIASARDTAHTFELDRVLLMLSSVPPHKPDQKTASAEQRLDMLHLATADIPVLEVSDLEVRRSGPSYTVDTLAKLAQSHEGDDELFLILGIDAYREINTWHRPGDLLVHANIIVTTRPGWEFSSDDLKPPVDAENSCWYDSETSTYVHASGHRLLGHEIDGINTSSTEIRDYLGRGLEIDDLTGPRVAQYIKANKLYGATAH